MSRIRRSFLAPRIRSNRRQKTVKVQSQNHVKVDHVDRISALPNDLLCHILSFLPTKKAAATSILSTRWRYLFTSLPNIHLEFDHSLRRFDPNSGKKYVDIMGPNYQRFARLVDCCHRLILQRKPYCLTKFYLSLEEFLEIFRVAIDSLICAAISCGVQQLEVFVGRDRSNALSPPGILSCPGIFSCKTLLEMKLDSCFTDFYVPETVSLPNLKILHLAQFILTDELSIPRLIQGCPVLIELSFVCLTYSEGEVLTLLLKSPSLEKIYLHCVTDEWDIVLDIPSAVNLECEVEGASKTSINAPKLQHLHFDGDAVTVNILPNHKSLVEARISVSCPYIVKTSDQEQLLRCEVAFELMNSSQSVVSLYLLDATVELLFYSQKLLPTFEKLTYLELEVRNYYDKRTRSWKMLSWLLGSAPNLQVLVFDEVFWDDRIESSAEDKKFEFLSAEPVPLCLPKQLREVKIRKFNGKEYEFKLIDYILQNVKALKKMTVGVLGHFGDRSKILSFKRCNNDCQIVFT
ncbi:F-box/LRR-repeat protein At3g59190-like [Coffea arabica]|uniref:F-box/LRR-repeat protein At3g59190-like n=1 Tax=Coffea arabica TaxID=13443 RepID=A0A6P6TF90_COFAR|nr:F-box/FBD/LRR-repeat protein At1g78750-like [Coffea arabica]